MPTTTGVAPETPVRKPESGSPDGSLTELAALEAARTEKRHLLDRAAAAARSQLGGKTRLPTGCEPDDLPALLQRYYWSEPAAEVLGHEPEELAGLALGHLKLAEVRPPGSATVDVQQLPDGRSVIRLVTDDMPYLVDSVTAEVIRQGVTLAHIVHPVVVVRRDLRGTIKAFCDSSLAVGCGSDALTESWMAVVVDGSLDDEAAADLVTGLRTVLEELPSPAAASDPADDPAEAAALLRWLAAGNFVFLGSREVELVESRGKAAARAVHGTGLGVLRSDTDMTASVAGMPEATR